MLKNLPTQNRKDKIMRIIMFSIIGIICVISIILAVVSQTKEIQPSPEIDTKQEEKEIIDFNSIFNNKLNKQEYTEEQVQKLIEDKEIVYTKYDASNKIDEKYDMDIKIPTININNTVITTINKEIEDIFRQKAINIIKSEEDYETIYTVEYTAYINSNILSLIIKSNLKEGTNAQRVIVKTYTYNMSSNQIVDINEMIAISKLDKTKAQKEINRIVGENAKQTQSLIELGYKVYERNISDEMYKIENVKEFFYGPNGVIYIIYAYGNNSYTSEIDVIPI